MRRTTRVDNLTRRSIVKAWLQMTSSAATLASLPSIARETIAFPSQAEILPSEWATGCVFTAVAVEGPYYIEERDFRRDIRDGQEGQELLLRLQVMDVARCEPLPEAVVELWHCNAHGYYSGYAGQDPDEDPVALTGMVDRMPVQSQERWLRGAQVSDHDGKCEFLTIYPGWYSGRTVHIHFKVHSNDARLITGQLYFPQELSDRIHQTGVYAGRGVSPYRNETDSGIAESSGAAGSWPTISREGETYVAALRLGVLNA